MKLYCSRALLLHRSHNLLRRPSRFLQVHRFSAAPSGNSVHGNQRRQEEDSRHVRVSVWWDFENCEIPAGVNEFKVAHAITTAIRTNGMKGPVQITAFGDVYKLARNRQNALSSSGINIVHIPKGGVNSADRSLLVDLLYWISQNPPPAHLFLISGDKDFAGILHRLRMSNYNILLASRESAPAALCCAASIMWQWSSLVKGEDFNGILYNQPPDGPYNSWYGHYRRPLEDPFAILEKQQALSKAKNGKCQTDPKMLSIKTVLEHVRQILRSHPKGISIQELAVELRKFHLCKDYYGYTTIAQFLEAIPHIAKLKLQSDGTCMVQPVTGPIHVPSELDVGRSAEHVKNKEVDCRDNLKVRIERGHDSGDSNEKRSSESSQELIAEGNFEMVGVATSADQNVKRYPQHENQLKSENMNTEKSEVQDKPELGAVRAQFLEAVPYIANLKLQSDGTCMVQPVTGPIHVPSELDVGRSAEHVKNKEVDCRDDLKVRIERGHDSDDSNEKRSSESSQEPIAEWNFKMVGVATSADRNVKRYPQHENQPKAENMNTEKSEVQDKPELDAVTTFWKRWFSYSDHVSKLECNETLKQIPAVALVKCVSSEDKSDKGTGKERRVSYDANASNLKELVSSSDRSANAEQASAGSDKYVDKSGTGTSLFQRAVKWCMFWKVDDKLAVLSEGSDGTFKQEQISHSARNEIFSKDWFWSEMKSFLESSTASIVFQSTTRAAMSENLQKVGPECLKTLNQSDLLHLVDLLISEKKFVQEQSFLPLPFKLARPASSAKPSLTSLFPCKQDGGEETKAGRGYITPPAVKKEKGPERPRGEILADCEKLVSEVIKEYPDGYNIGLFRTSFLEKYGYPLDLQGLGYQRVSDLLQTFPGVIVDLGHIIPSSPISKILHLVEAAAQDEVKEVESNVIANSLLKKQDDDSEWEELGAASVAEEKQEDELVGAEGYYEPVVIEDEFSESEDERRLVKQEGRRVGKQNNVSSSDNEGNTLLQILGLWDAREKDLGIGNGNPKLSISENNGRMGRTLFCNRRKHDKKSYSFVADDNQKPKMTTAIGESKKITA